MVNGESRDMDDVILVDNLSEELSLNQRLRTDLIRVK